MLLNTVLLLINAPKAAFLHKYTVYGIHGDIRCSLFGIRYTYMYIRAWQFTFRQHMFSMRSFREYEKYGLSVAGPRLYTRTCMKVFEYIPNFR